MVVHTVTLAVGNTYKRLRDDEAPLSKFDGSTPKVHKWDLFVQPLDEGVEAVSQVVFDLDPTFTPKVFTHLVADEQGRFKTTQTSFGGFVAGIRVTLRDGSEHKLRHQLHLGPGGAQQTIEVPLSRPGRVVGPRYLPLPDLTFGVEFELTLPPNATRGLDDFAYELRQRGVDIYAAWGTDRHAHSNTSWKLVSDSSVACTVGQPDCVTLELVSPILRYSRGLEEIERVLSLVQDYRPSVNSSAGFHVHVGFPNPEHRVDELVKLAATFAKFEDAIDLFMPASRRDDTNRFCHTHRHSNTLGGCNNKEANDYILSCRNLDELIGLFNPEGRYHKVNLTALRSASPTVEFRQHSSTTNGAKAVNWVRFCMQLVASTSKLKPPGNFRDGASAQEKLDRLFQWVVKDPKLHAHFAARAADLPRELCSCGASSCGSGDHGPFGCAKSW